MYVKSLVIAACVTAAPFTAYAAGDAGKPKPSEEQAEPVKAEDANVFVAKMAVLNRFERKIGRIAMRKSENKDVIAYGKMLVVDHLKAQLALLTIVHTNDIDLRAARKLPEVVEFKKKLRQVVKTLLETPKADFDAIFMQEMITGHQEAIDLITAGRESVTLESVKTLSGDLLPVLERHLKEAQTLQANLGT